MPTVLIAGASGVVGSAAVDRFLDRGWDVVAVSRRRPEVRSARPFQHVSVDLSDRGAAAEALLPVRGVEALVYAALFELPGLVRGWSERRQMETNLGMLQNVLEPMLTGRSPLRHVGLMQGTKAYGSHLHPIPVPARESAPRDPHENFYWLQEDSVRAAAADHGFAWTILRPQLTVGGAVGVAMNLVPVLGAYAAIARETREGFGFPGGPSHVWEVTDARVVAAALEWAAREPAATNQVFNVTNGDVFEWRNLWPAIADELGVEAAPDALIRLAEYLPARADVWDRIVQRYGLRPLSLEALLGESHHYADHCFATNRVDPPAPRFLSTVKIRRAGFGECMDTEETFRFWLRELIERRILPRP